MRLADQVDFVIGVDTHKNSHTIGVVDRHGAEHGDVTITTDAFGYRRMLAWINTKPELPEGPWCKDLGTFKLAGHGGIPSTFLEKEQPGFGQQI